MTASIIITDWNNHGTKKYRNYEKQYYLFKFLNENGYPLRVENLLDVCLRKWKHNNKEYELHFNS